MDYQHCCYWYHCDSQYHKSGHSGWNAEVSAVTVMFYLVPVSARVRAMQGPCQLAVSQFSNTYSLVYEDLGQILHS